MRQREGLETFFVSYSEWSLYKATYVTSGELCGNLIMDLLVDVNVRFCIKFIGGGFGFGCSSHIWMIAVGLNDCLLSHSYSVG